MGFSRKLIPWIVVLSLFLCGCGTSTAPSVQATAPPETVPAPTTELPQVTELPQTTERFQTTEPPATLHSGIREDGSFDEGTLFIGDSLTNGLIYTHLHTNGLLGDARYMSIVGATPQAFFNGPRMTNAITGAYSSQFDGMIFSEAVASAGDTVTAVYFMMGTNYSELTKAATYIEIVDYLLEHCPNATVYLQTIPYSESSNVHFEDTNWYILEAYGTYAMAGNARVRLLDAKHAIGSFLSRDGIHLSARGYACWYEELLAYAQENDIPQ